MLNKNGYQIFPGVISKKSSSDLFATLLKFCSFYSPEIFSVKNYKNQWNDKRFSKDLSNLRRDDKKTFSAIYDTFFKSSALFKFCYENNLDKLAGKCLETDQKHLAVRDPILRMDVGKDKRSTYGWHQDSAYDDLNSYSESGVVLWIPFIDTSEKNGSLIVKPKSHHEDRSCSYLRRKGTKYFSQQIAIKDKFLKKYKSKSLNVKANSTVVSYSGLFHKSGYNRTDKIRFTFVVRFNKIISSDFIYYKKLQEEKKI